MSSVVTIFTVHGESGAATARIRLAPHRFAWAGFWFGPMWLATNGLWIPAALALVFDGVAMACVRLGFLGATTGLTLVAMAGLLIGLDGNEWRRRALARKGASMFGVTFGVDETDALAHAVGADLGMGTPR